MNKFDNISAIVQIKVSCIEYNPYIPFKITTEYKSIGSGVFISEIHILTCFHVVNNATTININIPKYGKKNFKVKLISYCNELDIALLEIDDDFKSNYKLEMADSDKINISDKVNVIGYPIGSDKVKSTYGHINGIENYHIQVDAAINSGNSGGPLLDNNNIIIGINSQKIVSKEVDNIGYSIPINLVKDMLPIMFKQLIINKPKLFCNFYNNSDEYLEYYTNDKIDHGYIIKDIINDSPLYKLGIRSGDIFLQINEFKLDIFGEIYADWLNEKIKLNDLFVRYNIGDNINIKIFSISNKKILDFNYILQNYKKSQIEIFPTINNNHHYNYEIFGGLIISELKINHFNNLNLISEKSGENIIKLLKYKDINHIFKSIFFISNIMPGSYVDTFNIIKFGYIIKSINNININTFNEIYKAININNKYINIKFTNNITIILDTNKMLHANLNIYKEYNIKPTKIINLFKLNILEILNKN
tara:strand:+ start:5133 stop:6560 length:1428 start_codon:yes stop_codon:yes gene_type:complete